MRAPYGQDKIASARWKGTGTYSGSRAFKYFENAYILIPDYYYPIRVSNPQTQNSVISINKIPAVEAIASLLEVVLKLPKSPFTHI